MDRLQTLTAAVSLIILSCNACNTGSEEPKEQTRSRFASIASNAMAPEPSTWCDFYFGKGRGPLLKIPALVDVNGRSGGFAKTDKNPVWLSLWATWCAPCLREIPIIERWMSALGREGTPADLWLLSLDDDAQTFSKYLFEHAGFLGRKVMRLRRPDEVGRWLTSFGLPAETAIPVNIMADDNMRLLCIRTGAIADGDYTAVRSLFSEGNKKGKN